MLNQCGLSSLLSNLLFLLTLLIDQNASAIQIFGLFLDHMLKTAMGENVNIISLGDLNKNCMVNLSACVFDILTVNGLTNLIVNPTHFSGISETFIDPILVTDSNML